jgi:hypothetical protein
MSFEQYTLHWITACCLLDKAKMPLVVMVSNEPPATTWLVMNHQQPPTPVLDFAKRFVTAAFCYSNSSAGTVSGTPSLHTTGCG